MIQYLSIYSRYNIWMWVRWISTDTCLFTIKYIYIYLEHIHIWK